jgi:hypothetical protein
MKGVSALQLDEEMYPHVLYKDDGIVYAWQDASGWYSEVPMTGIRFELHVNSADLSIGSDGIPQASYDQSVSFDFPPYTVWDVTYCCRVDTHWNNETIVGGSGGNQHLYVSIELDGESRPHIAYNYQGLKYTYKDGFGLWNNAELVDSQHAKGISLILDGQNRQHISYATYYDGIVKYAYNDGSGWNIEMVDDQHEGVKTTLAIDEWGVPHIAYYVSGAGDLLCAHRGASGWSIEVVDEEGDVGEYVSLAVGNDRSFHIAYYDATRSAIKYAYTQLPSSLPLVGEIQGSQLVFSWSPVPAAHEYWIYGASGHPHFEPGFAPSFEYRLDTVPQDMTTWSSPNGIGDPENNWTYLVMAVDDTENEITRSNRVGEWDWGMEVP